VSNSDKAKSLLQLIDRKKFDALCAKWEMDKGVRTFPTWNQVGVLVMAYVMRLSSLREIEAAFGIARSTFSDANRSRSAGFFEELCKMVLESIQQSSQGRKIKRTIKALLAIDSTECRVHGSISSFLPWLQKSAKSKEGSAKLHVVWNVDGEWVEDFRITPGRRNDSPIGKQFQISSGKMYVFDRAYNDIEFWLSIIANGSDFTSRLKDCAKNYYRRKIIVSKVGVKNGVLWDGEWKPSQACLSLHPKVPKDFKCRHIIYRDEETKKVFDFVTSDWKSSAQDIADTYKRRWAVELLFRWFKGHLNIRYFEVRNPNAVKIQLATAVLVQLLVQLYRLINKFPGTLWDCLRAIRMELIIGGLEGSGFQSVRHGKPLLRKELPT
jgi:hypothetical protein